MARPRSSRTGELKAKLIQRLQHGFYQPGGRFFSNRDLARRFGVSYQTAHRLIDELAEEGWLERRAASGTFVAGQEVVLDGVQLVFNARARRPGSFGARLRRELITRLESGGVRWSDDAPSAGLFPVLWEKAEAMPQFSGRYALLLNDQPPAGLGASYVDSVSTDDFSGGVCAAQLLAGKGKRLAVLAGPKDDARSVQRVAGFVSNIPKARICWAGSWFYDDARRAAPRLLKGNPDAVFCCNDRLAEGVIRHCQENRLPVPEIMGFDDAPIAEELNFSTVSIPWPELADAAMAVIRKRLRGDTATASRQIFTPRPVIRRP